MSPQHTIARLALAALSACTLLGSAHAAGGIKAAYVEQVIPAHTWADSMYVVNAVNTVGPGTGILGVSSLTLTNYDASPQQVFIFVPTFSSGTCGSGVVSGGSTPRIQVYVQGRSTQQLTFPTPWVVSPYNGITCLAAEVTTLLNGGSVEIDVNGVIN